MPTHLQGTRGGIAPPRVHFDQFRRVAAALPQIREIIASEEPSALHVVLNPVSKTSTQFQARIVDQNVLSPHIAA